MAQSLSIPALSSASNTTSPASALKGRIDSPKSSPALPQVASLAKPPHKSLKRPSSPSFESPLTGAAAMAEVARQRELEEQRNAQMTSSNPAVAAKTALMGGTVSDPPGHPAASGPPPTPAALDTKSAAVASARPIDHPSSSTNPAAGEMSASASSGSILQSSAATSEPMHIEPHNATQTSPISMSGSESAHAFAVNNGSVDSSKTNTSADFSSAAGDERSNKAMTYPPQILPQGVMGTPATPARGMSVPGSAKSPLSGNKKHKCPHCATEFTRHHNLKSHLLTHSQEKPYGCQTCSARFRRLHDLKRHIKLHTGEKPHICNKCGRKFARGDALARHSKGPGGCAGRRGSAGGPGDLDYDSLDPDMKMDGVEYTGSVAGDDDDNENAEEDKSSPAYGRRRSEPNRMRKQSHQQQQHQQQQHQNVQHASPSASSASAAGGPYRQHSSTYPGSIAAAAHGPQTSTNTNTTTTTASSISSSTARHLHPPHDPSLTSTNATSTSSNRHLSPKSALDRGGYFSQNSTRDNSNLFAQGNSSSTALMTESPKSLSPGGHIPPPSGTSASSQGGVSLPPLAGITSTSPTNTNFFAQPQSQQAAQQAQNPGGGVTGRPPTLPAPGGANGAGASGSGGGGGANMDASQMWEYMRMMERRLQDEMAQKLQNQEAHYEGRIRSLQDELASLKGGGGGSSSSSSDHLRGVGRAAAAAATPTITPTTTTTAAAVAAPGAGGGEQANNSSTSTAT